ncbi:hypothetical protein niasHT_017873 [Heterodera trifolii]|uniref:Adenylate kinase n=1 Tax=Heterodera trifolii TaxID=157864 RepID=A0ABD2LFJ8_9BILA
MGCAPSICARNNEIGIASFKRRSPCCNFLFKCATSSSSPPGGVELVEDIDLNLHKVLRLQPPISIEIGSGVNQPSEDRQQSVLFLFGGPGSMKGILTQELAQEFDFVTISIEDLIFSSLPRKVADTVKNTVELQELMKRDPAVINLKWVLQMISARLAATSAQRFMVDIVPELSFIFKSNAFKAGDHCQRLEEFDRKHNVLFALELFISQEHQLLANITPPPAKRSMASELDLDPITAALAEQERQRTLVFIGLPESNAARPSERVQEDREATIKILDHLEVEAEPTAVFRLGRYDPQRTTPRPLKVVMPTPTHQHVALGGWKRERARLRSQQNMVRLFIRPALTKEQLKKEYEERVRKRQQTPAPLASETQISPTTNDQTPVAAKGRNQKEANGTGETELARRNWPKTEPAQDGTGETELARRNWPDGTGPRRNRPKTELARRNWPDGTGQTELTPTADSSFTCREEAIDIDFSRAHNSAQDDGSASGNSFSAPSSSSSSKAKDKDEANNISRGFDEADKGRLEKRLEAFHDCAEPFLKYFRKQKRVVKLDLKIPYNEDLSRTVRQLFIDIGFGRNNDSIRVVLFLQSEHQAEEIDTDYYNLRKIKLTDICHDKEEPLGSQIRAIRKYIYRTAQVDEHILVLLKGLNNMEYPRTKQRINFMEYKTTYLDFYIRSISRHSPRQRCRMPFRAITSTKGEVCLFPEAMSSRLCKKIGLTFGEKLSMSETSETNREAANSRASQLSVSPAPPPEQPQAQQPYSPQQNQMMTLFPPGMELNVPLSSTTTTAPPLSPIARIANGGHGHNHHHHQQQHNNSRHPQQMSS